MKINVIFVIVQILGALVILFNVIGNSQLSTKKVYIYNGICNGLSVLQYCLLGAWSGALCCIIAILRNVVFSKFKKEAPAYVILLYITIVILLNYKLVHNVLDVIPIFNIIIYSFALSTKKIMNIKVIGVVTCIDGFFYDLLNGAYVSVFNQLLDGSVGVRCIIILNKEKKKKTKKKYNKKSKSRTK